MKLSPRVLASLLGASPLLLSPVVSLAQTATHATGIYQGVAKVRDTDVPITVKLSRDASGLHAAFLNGPLTLPDTSPASSTTLDGNHLVASFDYFARTLDATLDGDTLTGTYGATHPGKRAATPVTFTAHKLAKITNPTAAANAPDISGTWEIATKSSKGEGAWELRVDSPTRSTHVVKAAIQRIDGDTGGLWGTWDGTGYTLTHFTAAGGAAYSVVPKPDGTLAVKSLLGGVHNASPELIARRPTEARKLSLPAPTETTQQTSVNDPSEPFRFSFPDLTGNVVSNSDPRFNGKVVIVAIGGSWCPNCHDEAPLLVNLYKRYHARGLEVVNLDFEQGDPETDTPRLQAFIKHYGIPYPVLVAGTTDQLNEKIPQGKNLNCWPTAFFLGRDGRVKEVHAGFAGPGNTTGHIQLEHEITALVENLLAQPATLNTASVK